MTQAMKRAARGTTAGTPKHTPRLSFDPPLLPEYEALEGDARCGGKLLDDLCAAAEIEVVLVGATFFVGQAPIVRDHCSDLGQTHRRYVIVYW